MRQPFALIVALAFALPLAGCIQNMADLRDRIGGAEEPIEPAATLEPSTTPEPNKTKILAPPVARITVFGPNGALVYKSTFQADDAAEVVMVELDGAINIMASDSETVEPGAKIVGFAWTLGSKPVATERQATLTMAQPGLHPLTLVVTDSNGLTDSQTIQLGVAPAPFEVVTEFTTGPVAGAEGQGVTYDHTFELRLADAGVPATIAGVTVAATAPATCDHTLTVFDPEGEQVATTDGGSVGETETLPLGALPEGDYVIRVGPFACVAPDGMPVTVTVLYQPTVEGLAAGDGHGHAH